MDQSLKVAVLGAGWAGLVAATRLRAQGIPVVVFEASPAVGGLASSFQDDEGFSFDMGAHLVTNRLVAQLGLEAECRVVRRYSEAVWLDGRSYGYPHGLALVPRFALSALRSRIAGRRSRATPASAGEELVARYGRALTDRVAAPLLEACSDVPAEQLAAAAVEKIPTSLLRTSWLRLAGKISRRAVAVGYCKEQPESASVWHVYPKGGLGRLSSRLAEDLQEHIRLDSPVEALLVEGGRVSAVRVAGREVAVRAVFSSVPVHLLPGLVQGTSALHDLSAFRFRSMISVYLKLRGRRLLPAVVLWMPDRALPAFRLTETTQSMPWLAPEGMTVVNADIGCQVGDVLWKRPDRELTETVLSQMEAVIPDVRARCTGSRVARIALAYPVFDRSYERQRRELANGLPIADLFAIGRHGEFDHLLMEDVYWRTVRSVDRFVAGLG